MGVSYGSAGFPFGDLPLGVDVFFYFISLDMRNFPCRPRFAPVLLFAIYSHRIALLG